MGLGQKVNDKLEKKMRQKGASKSRLGCFSANQKGLTF
ncbi:hypothetical protein ACFSCX_11770 [Bacillus salitolerans]|uniref:Uncharacterized protein n=1 Tax=Bacillus salitolerans TaxID=1437434 RepID=A0ABW4LSV9_9BACI